VCRLGSATVGTHPLTAAGRLIATAAKSCFTGLMLLMLACGLVLLAGTVLAVRWRGYSFAFPNWEERDPSMVGRPWLQLCWLLGVGGLTGLAAGVLVIGPAGRLVMRLLAANSPAAEGLETEAGETVGRISLGGTIGFILAVGISLGIAVALVYVLVAVAFPSGLLGGVLFGAGLLVVFGSTIDPLRADNPDFDILEHGWVAVVSFSTMALLTGAVTAAFAGRIGAALPAPQPWWLAWYLPGALFTVLVFFSAPIMFAIVGVGCLAFLAVTAGSWGLGERARRWGRTALQGVLAVAVLVTLPWFVLAVNDIIAE
jgi:hypothetical protein